MLQKKDKIIIQCSNLHIRQEMNYNKYTTFNIPATQYFVLLIYYKTISILMNDFLVVIVHIHIPNYLHQQPIRNPND